MGLCLHVMATEPSSSPSHCGWLGIRYGSAATAKSVFHSARVWMNRSCAPTEWFKFAWRQWRPCILLDVHGLLLPPCLLRSGSVPRCHLCRLLFSSRWRFSRRPFQEHHAAGDPRFGFIPGRGSFPFFFFSPSSQCRGGGGPVAGLGPAPLPFLGRGAQAVLPRRCVDGRPRSAHSGHLGSAAQSLAMWPGVPQQ